jgi:Tetracyclin repressor-like, C-terminal domain
VIKEQIKKLDNLKKELADKNPKVKLEGFFQIYSQTKSDNKICLVGSLATDFNTIEDAVQKELKILAGRVLSWVTEILEEGKAKNIFNFQVAARTKAIMIISNMLAIVQLSRLTKDDDFEIVKKAIIKELTHK